MTIQDTVQALNNLANKVEPIKNAYPTKAE